jgi:hypothetical protein
VRPPGFSSRRRHRYIPAERIHVRILGHIGRIPGSYLRDKSRHSSFIALTQLENHMSQSYLTDVISKIFWICINFSWVAPDGSNRSIFHRLCSRSFIVVEMLVTPTISSNSLTVASSSLLLLFYSLSDARSALPMGVAPEAIAEKFFPGIGSKDINSS